MWFYEPDPGPRPRRPRRVYCPNENAPRWPAPEPIPPAHLVWSCRGTYLPWPQASRNNPIRTIRNTGYRRPGEIGRLPDTAGRAGHRGVIGGRESGPGRHRYTGAGHGDTASPAAVFFAGGVQMERSSSSTCRTASGSPAVSIRT